MWTRKLHGSGTAAKPGWEGMRGQTGRGEGELVEDDDSC